MNRLIPIITAGAVFAGCGGSPERAELVHDAPKSVKAELPNSQFDNAVQEYKDSFGCAVPIEDIVISYVDYSYEERAIADAYGMGIEDVSIGGRTYSDNSIGINPDLPETEQLGTLQHEIGHACNDRINYKTLEEPIILDQDFQIIGFEGFTVLFDGYTGTDESQDGINMFTIIEEAMVDLQASQLSHFQGVEYGAQARLDLLKQINDVSGIDIDTASDLMQSDNLDQYLGLVFNKKTEDLTPADYITVINMFVGAYETGALPSNQEIESLRQ